MVAAISGIQSRGSWNNHRAIFKAFGDGLKTDPDVITVPEGKLLVCAKLDNPVEFVRSSRDLIHKSTRAELEEIVTGRKREKREPTADRHYKNLGVRAFWNEGKEDLRFKGMTPAVREVIYEVLDKLESEARELDNALSTLLDDGSFDWTGYWADTAKDSEITIRCTTAKGQFTFWDPEKGQVPYKTWAEVVAAVRAENAEAYIVVAEGPEHRIAKTSLAGPVPQTYVTVPTELLGQLPRMEEAEEKPDSVEEPDQTGKAAETSEQAEAQDHTSSPEDETPEGDDQGAEGDSAPEDNLVERVEADGWTPGEGWTEHQGSLDLTDAFGNVKKDERYVNVHVSFSGRVDDAVFVDPRDEDEIPLTWDDLIQYLESEEFAPYHGARLIWFTNEEGKPYLYAVNGDGWKVWSNVSAIPLSN